MPSRLFARLLLLASLVALTTSAHLISNVVSGFNRTKVSDVTSGSSRTDSHSNTPDDGVWQAATRVATTSGSSVRSRTQYIRVQSFAGHIGLITVWDARPRDLPNAVRDHSPQHSLPLLI